MSVLQHLATTGTLESVADGTFVRRLADGCTQAGAWLCGANAPSPWDDFKDSLGVLARGFSWGSVSDWLGWF